MKKIILLAIAFCLLFISVGYSSKGKINNLISFSNCTDESVIIKNDNISFSANLKQPGDIYDFYIDITNNNTKALEIINILKTNVEDKKYLIFNVTYKDGKEIKKNDIIEKNENKPLHVKVIFNKDINNEDLPKTSEIINLNYELIVEEIA